MIKVIIFSNSYIDDFLGLGNKTVKIHDALGLS